MDWNDLNTRKKSTFIFLGVAIAFIGFIALEYIAFNDPDTYARKIVEIRKQKDNEFKRAIDSPIKEEDRKKFKRLWYFPPDESYHVKAKLIEEVQKDTLTLVTTAGSDYQVVRAGVLEFSLQGITHRLATFTYLEKGKNTLFVPFTDLTSGSSTYGGGRYMEIPLEGNGIWVDFNRAYNPFCVYNETFVCPLPPAENKLSIEVMAGEKDFRM